MLQKIVAAAILAAICVSGANAHTVRNAKAKAEFIRENPCPATGARRGPCAGYIVDHVTPLACGGADAPHNMQWQTIAEAREKDRTELKICKPQHINAAVEGQDIYHGGGLNACGCHMNRREGTCHCHRPKGCGCACQPATCR